MSTSSTMKRVGGSFCFCLAILAFWGSGLANAQSFSSGDFREDLGPRCTSQGNPPRPGVCKPLVRCITFYAELAALRRQPCPLHDGHLGVCCPNKGPTPPPSGGRESTGVLVSPPPPPVQIPPLKVEEIQEAVNHGLERVRQRAELEQSLFTNQIVVEAGTPEAHHQDFFQTTDETLEMGNEALKNLEASVELVNNFQLSPDQGTFGLPRFSILNTVIADSCPRPPPCPDARYRSFDGSCNNLRNRDWGKANTAFQRILQPKYGDGVNTPRLSSRGEELPSARLVSTTINRGVSESYDNYTLMIMQWGQFLDHDLTHTPIAKGTNQAGISCCRRGRQIDESVRHPECFAIPIPDDDSFYSRFRQRCMEFVRSLPAPRPECNFGPREQMNQITGFLDASNVYGSSVTAARNLREGRNGRLKVHRHRNRDLMPLKPNECSDTAQERFCFQAGDARANEQVDLTVVHTLWVREHNRIAGELQRLNPQWNDEILFQEARRIVAAEMQHITYNEYLPLILGNAYMSKFGLLPKEEGYSDLYNDAINPSITNVFSAAAYRYGHTLIPTDFQGFSPFGRITKNLELHSQQFAPFELYEEDGLDSFVRGLTNQPSQKFDHVFTTEITNRLFQSTGIPFGLDLVALNIQRGRDHGLPPYNEWREVCGQARVRTWNDLNNIMDSDVIQFLQQIYDSVEDIDLFAGGSSEKPLPGALLGPTFVCLVGDQFARLRRGDRFYYEENAGAGAFTLAQLQQIRKASLARILCDNSDDIGHMQPLAFIQASFINKRISCNNDAIPRVDLTPWSTRTQ